MVGCRVLDNPRQHRKHLLYQHDTEDVGKHLDPGAMVRYDPPNHALIRSVPEESVKALKRNNGPRAVLQGGELNQRPQGCD